MRITLEFLSKHTHSPCHQRDDSHSEESKLPTCYEKCRKIKNNENRILDEHIKRTGYRILNLSHITTHSGYYITFLLLREEAERETKDLVVHLHPQVTYDSCPQWDHHCRRPEITRCLEKSHHAKKYAKKKKGRRCTITSYQFCNPIICVIENYILHRKIRLPWNKLVHSRIRLEQNVQDRYYQGERKDVEYSRQYVHDHSPNHTCLVWRGISLQNFPEFSHQILFFFIL